VWSNFVLFLHSIQSDLTYSLRHLHNQVVYSGQQYNAQAGIISSMGQSAIPTEQNIPQTNTLSAISQMGQQTPG
jgi:hypothetical protein